MNTSQLEVELPEGKWATWSSEEWVCNCPFCGKEEKFTWNVTKNVGNCWSCSRWINGKNKFLYLQKDNLSKHLIDLDSLLKNQYIDNFNRNYLVNAWDHPKSKEFLISRNVNELVAREASICYYPPKKTLYLETKAISKGLDTSYLWRQIPNGKWFHKKGTKSIFYCWGLEKIKNPTNILLCDGVS